MPVRRLKQAGDTIVEVLIVLAVLGMALGVAYATASRSLEDLRDVQEHTEALEIIQGQIENLRIVAGKSSPSYPPGDIYTNPAHSYPSFAFCILDPNDPNPLTQTPLTLAPGTSDACTLNNFYHAVIWSPSTGGGGSGDIFHISVQWDRVTGGPQGHIDMTYRIRHLP